jgi:hypothetical protein
MNGADWSGWAHDYRLMSFLAGEAQRDQGRTDKARKRYSDSKQCHERRGDGHDVTEVAQTKLLAESLRACRSYRRDDLAPLVIDHPLLVHNVVFAVLTGWMIRIVDANASCVGS